MKISVIAIAAVVQLATTIEAFVVPTTSKTTAAGRNGNNKNKDSINKNNLVECHATKKGRGEGYGPPLDNISEGTWVVPVRVLVIVASFLPSFLCYWMVLL